jgi:hypothetical protein
MVGAQFLEFLKSQGNIRKKETLIYQYLWVQKDTRKTDASKLQNCMTYL